MATQFTCVSRVEPRAARWYDHDGQRHAIPQDLANGTDGKTLCDLDVTPIAENRVGTLPTCVACEDAWRVAEGLPTRQQIENAIAAQLPQQKGAKR